MKSVCLLEPKMERWRENSRDSLKSDRPALSLDMTDLNLDCQLYIAERVNVNSAYLGFRSPAVFKGFLNHTGPLDMFSIIF